jgi:hypothetical protein
MAVRFIIFQHSLQILRFQQIFTLKFASILFGYFGLELVQGMQISDQQVAMVVLALVLVLLPNFTNNGMGHQRCGWFTTGSKRIDKLSSKRNFALRVLHQGVKGRFDRVLGADN